MRVVFIDSDKSLICLETNLLYFDESKKQIIFSDSFHYWATGNFGSDFADGHSYIKQACLHGYIDLSRFDIHMINKK